MVSSGPAPGSGLELMDCSRHELYGDGGKSENAFSVRSGGIANIGPGTRSHEQ